MEMLKKRKRSANWTAAEKTSTISESAKFRNNAVTECLKAESDLKIKHTKEAHEWARQEHLFKAKEHSLKVKEMELRILLMEKQLQDK